MNSFQKISAHEFERGGLLKPIVNTIDGTPTFLSIGPPMDNGGVGGSCSNLQNVGGVVAGQYQYNHQQHHHNHAHLHHSQHSHYQAGGAVGSSSLGSTGGASGAGGAPSLGGSGGAGNGHQYPYYHCHQRPQRLSRNELKQLDEKELIFELVSENNNIFDYKKNMFKLSDHVLIKIIIAQYDSKVQLIRK